jgi:hypothetical protein
MRVRTPSHFERSGTEGTAHYNDVRAVGWRSNEPGGSRAETWQCIQADRVVADVHARKIGTA